MKSRRLLLKRIMADGKQVGLDLFTRFLGDFAAYQKDRDARKIQQRIKECEQYIVDRLSEGPDYAIIFWRALWKYEDIKDLVVARLKREKVIRLFLDADVEEGDWFWAYCLNIENERVKRFLDLRKRRKGTKLPTLFL